jgi:hypothetical protein
MDKEPNLAFVWLVFPVIGAGAYWGAKARGWLLAPALGVIALAVWVMLHDLSDRQVGPTIIEEAGWSYVIVSVLPALVAAAPPSTVPSTTLQTPLTPVLLRSPEDSCGGHCGRARHVPME